jgi:hypothetical protein
MSKSKRTADHWYLIATEGTDFTAIATVPSLEGKNWWEVEILGSSEWLRAKPEHLQLMAAAPDLYRELQHLVRLLETYEESGDLNVYGLATLNGARAALSRAKSD